MIFGNCNLKIKGLYPRLDGRMSDYSFSVGIKKEFAKKCFEKELEEYGYRNLQHMGEEMIKKTWGDYPLLITKPYTFYENSKGNLTCLIRNLCVPGDACGLDTVDFDLERVFNENKDYKKFIEYLPHNIDAPIQCYELLSLLTSWEETMDSIINEKEM